MQYIILAGGLGTRLRPRTLTVPKPMIPILGKPFLGHQLDYLRRQGIKEALLLIGHLGDQISDYFGAGGALGMRLDYSREEKLLGTGGALKRAEHKIHDDFVVIYGDSFLPMDYAAFEKAFKNAGREGMIAVCRDADGVTGVRPNVALAPDGIVTRYDKRTPSPELNCVEAGVLAFKKRVLERIPGARVVSLENDLYPQLIREGQLGGYVCGGRFFDIGTEERIETMEAWLKNDYLTNAVPR